MSEPLMLNGRQARILLGLGRHTFRRLINEQHDDDGNLVREAEIPSWRDPDTGTRWFHRPALEAWSANNGRAA